MIAVAETLAHRFMRIAYLSRCSTVEDLRLAMFEACASLSIIVWHEGTVEWKDGGPVFSGWHFYRTGTRPRPDTCHACGGDLSTANPACTSLVHSACVEAS